MRRWHRALAPGTGTSGAARRPVSRGVGHGRSAAAGSVRRLLAMGLTRRADHDRAADHDGGGGLIMTG